MTDDLNDKDIQATAYDPEYLQETEDEFYGFDLDESLDAEIKVKSRLTNTGEMSVLSGVETLKSSEDTWTKESPASFNLVKWLLIAGGSFLAIIVLSLAFFLHLSKVAEEEVSGNTADNLFDEELKENPETWFYSESSNVHTKAIELLRDFKAVKDDATRSKLVRNPDFYLALAKNSSVNITPRLSSKDSQQWLIGQTEGVGYLRLICKDEDYMPLNAYFVREDESLKLDLAATLVWSELSPRDRLVALADSEERIFRCLISRTEEFYSESYNDKDHAHYTLRFADGVHTMWGYAEAGSELDLQLKEILDYGSFIRPLKKNVRVTLKVARKSKDALPKQIDIVELLHEEWVTPDRNEHDE